MKGRHPKRRKAKDNLYSICEVDGRFFLSFIDGEGNLQEFEITRTLYDIFNRFELDDLVYLSVWDRHIEHSEVWDNTLYAEDIRKLLGIGRTKVYEFLDEVYAKQEPFRVIKIGKMYKIPCRPFDKWLSGE